MIASPDRAAEISALLGPTNTGKTHRAVERMLDYESGMLGVPLRLLARELYERVVARVGDDRVALLTGEEKHLPAAARYFVCTTESMPVERDVEFVAVDEIQLAAHRQRGHTFTSRLLHCRGTSETWFLGSSTADPIVRELVPTARIVDHPRYSILRHTGQSSLGRLAPRSAIVAFSAAEVYRLAERVRQRHGGVAVVLGALSPRTRNAQVDLYQAGDVHHIVATDAIGMGLNMDIDHVAFAGLRKFDGTGDRLLDIAELAQIAGRAGRYRNDGTFGTLAPVPALGPATAKAIEEHRFAALTHVQWRNEDLDFRSLERLAASLRRAPPRRCLLLPDAPDDERALAWLTGRSAVRARCRGPHDIALLWDLCQIPDYQKLLVDHHVELLEQLFVQLTEPSRRLDNDWLAQQLRPLDDTSGGIDRLMARIGFVRTWTFVTHRRDWVADPQTWQARTRELEDRLSDALHEALVRRFVDTSAGGPVGARKPSRHGEPDERREVTGWHQPLSALGELTVTAPHDEPPPKAAFVDGVCQAPDEHLSLDRTGRIEWHDGGDQAVDVGHLGPGKDLLTPQVHVRGPFALDSRERARLAKRLTAWLRAHVERHFDPLFATPDELGDAGRGLLYELAQSLGALPRHRVEQRRQQLTAADRKWLRCHGIVFGQRFVFVPRAWQRDALALRWTLCAVVDARLPADTRFAARSIEQCGDVSADVLAAHGYVKLDDVAIRLDLGETLLGASKRAGPTDLDAACRRIMGLPAERLSTWLARPQGRPTDGTRRRRRRKPRHPQNARAERRGDENDERGDDDANTLRS